jgi:hypothetical protein
VQHGKNERWRCADQDAAEHLLRCCALSPRCGCIVPGKLVKRKASISPSILHGFIKAARRHCQRGKIIVTLIPCGSVSLLDSLRFRMPGLQESVVVKPMAEIGRPFA